MTALGFVSFWVC